MERWSCQAGGHLSLTHSRKHHMNSTTEKKKQVISIRPDGSIVGLDHKRKGFNLRKMGKASTKRVTLVEWDEEEQAWEVFYQRPLAGGHSQPIPWGQKIAKECRIDIKSMGGRPCKFTDSVFFKDYEDGVAFEVAVIQAKQLQGKGGEIFR